MKKQKIIAVLLAAEVCAGLACGCKATDDIPAAASASSKMAAADQATPHIKQTFSNGLSINADVIVPKGVDTKAVKIQKVKAVSFPKKTVLQTLFKNTKIKTKQSQNQGATRGGNQLPSELYVAEDGSECTIDSAMGFLSYGSPLSEAISYAYFDSEAAADIQNNRACYKKKNLSFMTAQQAVKKAEDILTQFGVPPLSQPKVVALDHETLQKQEVDPQKYKLKPTDKTQKKGTWTKADECYVLYFHQKINDIPIGTDHIFPYAFPPKIVMYLGKNGVVKLDMTAYKPTNDAEETKPVVPVEQAVKTFTTFYGSAQLPSAAQVTNIRLQYALKPTSNTSDVYQYSPVWTFIMSVKEKNKDQSANISKIYVDALTGKLIRQ
ncbi:MAG: two-component system regulatory protein YycI [Oscillospiraceae bacterium]|nr:two-component system regulatory protein YycI [Oscillospiraceae bacterium]